MAKKPVIDAQQCGECKYSEIPPKEDDGQCRRYPPVIAIINDEPATVVPVIARDDWCGEFARRCQS